MFQIWFRKMRRDEWAHIPQNTEQWLDIRKSLDFTASEVPALLNVDPNKSKAKMLLQKRNPKPQYYSQFVQVMMNKGKLGEALTLKILKENPSILAKAKDKFLQILNIGPDSADADLYGEEWKVTETGLWLNVHTSFGNYSLGSSPDALIVTQQDGPPRFIVEIKTPSHPRSKGTYPQLHANPPSMPHHHYIQMQMQMNACDVEYGIYMVYSDKVITMALVRYHDRIMKMIGQELSNINIPHEEATNRKHTQKIKQRISLSMSTRFWILGYVQIE